MKLSATAIYLATKGMFEFSREDFKDLSPKGEAYKAEVGTILANMAYYGYAPSAKMLNILTQSDATQLKSFWSRMDAVLSEITGDNRNISEYVVYQNFPKEVLSMSDAEYWIKQICMYIGFENHNFTQEAEVREPLNEEVKLSVIDITTTSMRDRIASDLAASKSSWTDVEMACAIELFEAETFLSLDIAKFAFRANGCKLAVHASKTKPEVIIKTTSATDVLRICAGYSDGPVDLSTSFKFKSFPRAMRRNLVSTLNGCADLKNDFARHPELWKQLLSRLHPGDYNHAKVNEAYADLYNGSKGSLNSIIEQGFKALDPDVLLTLKRHPGVFMRMLHRAYGIFGNAAFEAFKDVIEDLTVEQILKIQSYLRNTVEAPKLMLVRPKGNWSKAKVIANEKPQIASEDLEQFIKTLRAEIARRVNEVYPQGVDLDPEMTTVKLQSNGQELATYGRGTEFDLAANTRFVRTASYWENPGIGNSFFDNTWNFFYEDWSAAGTCSWDFHQFSLGGETLAVFSGDPTNSKDMEGKACQLIDLYLDKLEQYGVRYAVWGILCFSGIAFSGANEVFATLQTGEGPQEGKLYEPSRAQLAFPLIGDGKMKYIAYLDVKLKKIIYMDANLPGSVHEPNFNGDYLVEQMKAFKVYKDQQPSVGDLFQDVKVGTVPIVKSDRDTNINGDAYVFKPENTANNIRQIDLDALLALKGKTAA